MLPLLLASLASLPPIPPADQEPDPEISEAISDEAATTARAFCSGLKTQDPSKLLATLTSDFHASGLSAEPLDGAHFSDALFARAAQAAIVRRCTFKPFQFQTNKAHDVAIAKLWLTLDGLDKDGKRFADHGDVEARLIRKDGKLVFAELALEPRKWTSGGAPMFTDVTRALGIDQSFEKKVELRTLVGGHDNGGISIADFDGDGDLDIYVCRDGKNLLYRNDGDGHFTEVAQRAGVADPGNGRAAIFVDLDNDGDLDLFVANKANEKNGRGNRLYRNDGHGHFTDITESAGVGQVGPYTHVAAADIDGDGLIDLYVTAYGEESQHPGPTLLDAHNGRPNLLLHNLGHMKFEEIAKNVGVAGREWSYAAELADLDGDHKPELIVINDWGAPRLYQNLSTPGRVKFKEVTKESGIVDPGNGMGVDIGDVDGDGKPDIHISKMYSTAGNRLLSQVVPGDPHWLEVARNAARGDSLFHNDGNLHFTEVGESAGIRRGGWAWSCEMADVDDDGDLDLFVTNGFHTGQREDEL